MWTSLSLEETRAISSSSGWTWVATATVAKQLDLTSPWMRIVQLYQVLSRSHKGPFHHKWKSMRSAAIRPLEAQSTAFDLESTCRQAFLGRVSRISEVLMDPSSFVTLLYTTAAYSLVEASENPWSSILSASLATKRGNWNFCRVSRSALHFSQLSASLVGSGSFQSKFKSQSFWKIILNWITIGAKSPSGSNILETSDKTCAVRICR